jgi:S1-C subfamily serine protease
MIQTDAPIAPGSSGGALLDNTGAVIGITTAIAVTEVGAEGLGFATPIDLARSVADDIIETGSAHHVWLGIEGIDLDHATADELSVAGGARIHKVVDGSPAALAGLEEDDVIVSVEGEDVESMSALIVALRSHDPGDKVHIGYVRDGQRGTMVLELSERPES